MTDDVTRSLSPDVNAATRSFAPDGATAPFPHDSAVPERPVHPEIPGYELIRILGRGGMGLVYQARQLATNRTVAVKLMLAGELAGEAARQRFRLETEATAKLSHPHIVQLYEAGDAGGRAFFSCEFMAGGSLASKLDGTPWDGIRAAKLVLPLARAVADAHAAGVVHRDLKPANVLLGADGTPKVADFGLAKTLDSDSNTHTGAILGTPSYMPPEQAGGAKAVGPAADVYSLGAILYELVTGRPPFKGADFVSTIDQVRTQEPVAPRILQHKLPRDVETIALKCLQKEPAKRYESATALADDLQRFLDGRPIAARPVGGIERAWRWAKRAPAVAALLLLTFLLFTTGTAVSVYFAVNADAARDRAEAREKDATDAKRDADARSAELLAEKESADHLLYISQMNHAQFAANDLRTARLTELLDLTRPAPGKKDHRNWEWHYLHRLAHSWNAEASPQFGSLARSKKPNFGFGFGGGVGYPFITQNGAHLVTPGGPNTLIGLVETAVFDTKTGSVIRSNLKPSEFMSPDGRWFVDLQRAGSDGTSDKYQPFLRDTQSGTSEKLSFELTGQHRIFVSAGGARIVLVPVLDEKLKDPATKVWDRGTTSLRRIELRRDPDGRAFDPLDVSPDGTTAFVVTDAEGTPFGRHPDRLEIWDIRKDPKLRKFHVMPKPLQGVLRFSANGTTLAGRFGNEIVVFDASSGERVAAWPLPPHALDPTFSDSYASDDGCTVVHVGKNAVVSVGRRVTNNLWRSTFLLGPSKFDSMNPFVGACIWLAPDGRELIATRPDGKMFRWDLRAAPGYMRTWPSVLQHNGVDCYGVASRRGEHVLYFPQLANIVGNKSAPVGLFDPSSNSLRWGELPPNRYVESLRAIPPDGMRVALSLSSVELMDNQQYLQRSWTLRAITPSGRDGLKLEELAGGVVEANIEVRSSDSGRMLSEPLATREHSFSYGLAAGFRIRDTSDGTIKLTDRRAGESMLVAATAIDPTDRYVANLRFPKPADGKQQSIVTLCSFDIAAGKSNWEWTLPAPITVLVSPAAEGHSSYSPSLPSIAYSPDGNRIALAVRQLDDAKLHVRVFDSATGAIVRDVVEPPNDQVLSHSATVIAFDSNGRIVVGDGRNAVVWNATDSEPKKLIGHEGTPSSACLNADGSRLFTLDLDTAGTRQGRIIRVWDLHTGKEVIAIREPPPSAPGIGSPWSEEMWLEGEKLMLMTSDGVLVFDGTPR
ncbi:MAG: WD40 repeat domain-containing serine/threonine-protein kinase [Gemmataceae bacterium]